MCDYCEGKKPIPNNHELRVVAYIGTVPPVLYARVLGLVSIMEPIDYCPKCGRDLRGGDHD